VPGESVPNRPFLARPVDRAERAACTGVRQRRTTTVERLETGALRYIKHRVLTAQGHVVPAIGEGTSHR